MLISLSILSVSQMHLKINQVLIMKKKNHNMFNNEIDFSLKVGRKKEGNYRKTVREKKKTAIDSRISYLEFQHHAALAVLVI